MFRLPHTLCLLLALLAACAQHGPRLATPHGAAPPVAYPFDSMPLEAATITSAAAVQLLTPPLEVAGNVGFAPAAQDVSDLRLGMEGFAFTHAALLSYRRQVGATPGMVTGRIGVTCPLDRRVEVLFLAEFVQQDTLYRITRLEMAPVYTPTPRFKVFVLQPQDLPPYGIVGSYSGLVQLLADKAIAPQEFWTMDTPRPVFVFAVGLDPVDPGAELTLAMSDTAAGPSGYSKESRRYAIDGWPVLSLVGTFDPSDTANPLFAKVLLEDNGPGSPNTPRLLCAHRLTRR